MELTANQMYALNEQLRSEITRLQAMVDLHKSVELQLKDMTAALSAVQHNLKVLQDGSALGSVQDPSKHENTAGAPHSHTLQDELRSQSAARSRLPAGDYVSGGYAVREEYVVAFSLLLFMLLYIAQ